MTEAEAKELVRRLAGHKAIGRLEHLVALVVAENSRQNLIAASTVASIWSRHVLDSVQLLSWSGNNDSLWLDIGSGGGFPGLAIAAVSPRPMMLAEPRRTRAEFLKRAAAEMALPHVEVRQARVEAITTSAAVISARAVAPIDTLFRAASRHAAADTRWLLPRGASHAIDAAEVRKTWDGMFHVEQSLSDPQAGIVVATGISPR